jgi:hypothetical protein
MPGMTQHLANFDFVRLFNELGWDQLRVGLEKEVGGHTYALQPIAIKRGVQVLRCAPGADGEIPPYAIRQKIERKVTTDAREHLIIFTDAARTRQIWQWVARAPGRPTQYREVKWQQGQATALLEQKLKAIAFDLDEEESLTVFGVAERLRGGFDRDNVTKKFYKVFQTQREAFQRFIAGIPDADHARWYTAVVIDRLMFLWFLQEKYFLDNDKRYLRNRLDAHLSTSPETSFYKRFLCPLFFRGFAEERTETNRAVIQAEFGNVPYLNGGLFAEHELEREYGAAIDIPDAAFAALFEFFDQWDWHLDERPLASGKEVNPDVLGYIFEKFVNQKQMGAYYTKEDITEYIAKNTIIPCLFDKVRADHVAAFDAHVWPLLQEEPRRYLYPAMLHGVDEAYPEEIAAGIDTEAPDLLERRKPWNKPAAPSHALPTEIWRETIARHQRTREVLAKLEAGEVRSVADLITYNLNIRQFAQDVIERCTDPVLLRAFWVVLAGRLPRKSSEKFRHGLSVLDPTCGSGAFLFAALQILKPLYQACLTAMSGLLADEAIQGRPLGDRWKDIEETVERFQAGGTDRQCDYAVLKHIIVHNLYGVDIEAQATEIAKLRLFLKLVALLEPGDEIEPLPDIDFNIRAGNTLVGYASAAETERAVMGEEQQNLFTSAWDDIQLRLVKVEQEYNNFQIQQVQRGGHVTAEDKRELCDQLGELEETLNRHLYREYEEGKDPKKRTHYGAWKNNHKPFHWYVDFYPIMEAGGFDVVIGNPPWAEYATVRKSYTVSGYQTEASGNLYGLCTERSLGLSNNKAYFSFIVQLPLVSSSRMASVRTALRDGSHSFWVATFDDRPGRLFEGLQHCRSTIFMAKRGKGQGSTFTTRYHRWPTTCRNTLFMNIHYLVEADSADSSRIAAKHASGHSIAIFGKVATSGTKTLSFFRSRRASENYVFYQEATQYWVKGTSSLPFYAKNGICSAPSHGRYIYFDDALKAKIATALINSSLFYAFFVAYGDCFHLSDKLAAGFPTPDTLLLDEEIGRLNDELMRELESHAERKTISSRNNGVVDRIEYDEYYGSRCKGTIDKIDLRLAQIYEFTPEELDYIINYDIKYRMGLNGEEAAADD